MCVWAWLGVFPILSVFPVCVYAFTEVPPSVVTHSLLCVEDPLGSGLAATLSHSYSHPTDDSDHPQFF